MNGLYTTGNYDAIYFAGMIADPKAMTECDFDRWIEVAYFHVFSDYTVMVTLTEAKHGVTIGKSKVLLQE